MSILTLKNALLDNRPADIEIEEGFIVSVSPSAGKPARQEPTSAIDCTGLAAYPGLCNMHSHAPMTLFRGLGDDQPLARWLNDYIWPAERGLDDGLVYRGTLQACREMLATGTTFFNDMYFRLPAMAQAVEESGIGARLGLTLFGDAPELDSPALMEPLSHPTGRVSYSLAPHSVYTVTPRGLRRAAEACAALGLPMHIHMSETEKEVRDCLGLHGCRPWELLDRLGILDLLAPNIIAAHCLHLSDHEIKLIGQHRLTVVHCPNSNLKLGSGYRFPMLELMEAGATVRLGTDGAASSNNLDLLEATKTAALLQKGWRADPTACPATAALGMATAGHTLEPGQPADIMLLPEPSVSNLVYATHGDRVALTIAGGRVAYRNDKG